MVLRIVTPPFPDTVVHILTQGGDSADGGQRDREGEVTAQHVGVHVGHPAARTHPAGKDTEGDQGVS